VSSPGATAEPTSASEAVAGFLAAAAIFVGGLELVYRPFRLAPVALLLLLVATVMSRRHLRLIALGFAVVGVCFVVGAGIAVWLHHAVL
jgi:hypothetical protein